MQKDLCNFRGSTKIINWSCTSQFFVSYLISIWRNWFVIYFVHMWDLQTFWSFIIQFFYFANCNDLWKSWYFIIWTFWFVNYDDLHILPYELNL
jgi:hypothetical protein